MLPCNRVAFDRQELNFHSGSIGSAFNLEFADQKTYNALSVLSGTLRLQPRLIVLEGLNGQMPNLDLINIMVRIATSQGRQIFLQDRILERPPGDLEVQKYTIKRSFSHAIVIFHHFKT